MLLPTLRRALGVSAVCSVAAYGQATPSRWIPPIVAPVTLAGLADEILRNSQLADSAPSLTYMLRSTSSLSPRLGADSAARSFRWAVVLPESRFTYNTELPFSMNDGALWAGVGGSGSAVGGIRAEWGPVRFFALPEIVYSENRWFDPPAGFPVHPYQPPGVRHPLASPWHGNGQSIDLPFRLGEAPIKRITGGQSSLLIDLPRIPATIGASTENEWWGPGLRNSLLLSNNAQGFPHVFARTAQPVHTPIGNFQARWIAGWLRESGQFDFDAGNDLRSISLLGLLWTPHADSGLTLGVARSVFGTTPNRSHALLSFYKVFTDVGHPNDRGYLDSTITPGDDQLFSLFFRWVLPKEGFEAYAEWGRQDFPVSLRDFLAMPNHSQGYTLGFQWLGDPMWRESRLRAQAEFTYIEQGTTFRFRNVGSWYTSHAVVQGYTNAGQSLGAAIGPAASSQWLAVDYILPRFQLGVFFNRIRWDEDAHSQQPYNPRPNDPSTFGWCEHDVSMLPGVRSAVKSRWGNLALEYTSGWRYNVYFENSGPCPISYGRDQRNKTLSLTFTP